MDRNLTKQGFRYLEDDEVYEIRFPVYLYKGKPVIECKLIYNPQTTAKVIHVLNVGTDEPYAHWYNRYYGKNSVVPIIESNIKKKFSNLRLKPWDCTATKL